MTTTTQYTVEPAFEAPSYVADHWSGTPVLYRSVPRPPFAADEVFRAAVAASGSVGEHALPARVQFTVGRRQQEHPGGHLPQQADGSWEGYVKRSGQQLDGARHALVMHYFHAFDHGQWARERAFCAGLWRQLGQPTGSITTLFHGNYEHSPVGVHRDRFATMMFVLRGHKRMRFWAERPWTEPVSSVLDYRPYLGTSFAVDVGPGELLAWSSAYYHVGETVDEAPATSVNIGIPCEEHHPRYDVQALLARPAPDPLADPAAPPRWVPPVDAPLYVPEAPDADAALPPALTEALGALRTSAGDPGVAALTTSLRHWTSGGLEPVPLPRPVADLHDTAAVRAPDGGEVLWSQRDGVRYCAAYGHVTQVPDSPAVSGLLRTIRSGAAVPVGDLLAGFPDAPGPGAACTRADARRLVRELVSFRALEPDPLA